MRIVVCVKQVPEVSELSLDPVTRRLRRDGVPLMLNPFDRRAVLEATRLREELGGTIAVLSMGPPATEAALRECLSLGVDRAVHLCDARFAGADTLATARALARAIVQIGFDLVLLGRFSIDSETGQVGPEVAALLDVPLLSGVRRLAIAREEDGRLTARAECERDDGFADVACALPLVATCTDRWKTKAPIVVPDEEAGATRPLERWSSERLGGSPDEYGAAGSPTWVDDVQPVALERRREVVVAADGLDAAVDAVLREVEEGRAAGRRAAAPRVAQHVRRTEPRDAVWVVVERSHEGRLRPVAAELLGAADALATRLGVGVCAFVADPDVPGGTADDDAAPLAATLGALGADVLLWRGDGAEPSEEALAADLAAAIRTHAPRIVLAPATGLGRDVIPRVAAQLGLGLTGDAIGVELDGSGRLRQLKPAFGGQLVAPILSRTRPEMVTLRPGVLEPLGPSPERPPAAVVPVASAGVPQRRVRVLGFTPELASDTELDAARVVVCIGYGLGSAERVPEARELAAALGGVLGATRRVCDVGWVPRQMQIGISGRSVSPDVYLGLGVRGSFNHMVGMQRAGRVIAVNRDPQAEIFAGADLAVVADAPELLRALLERLRGASPTPTRGSSSS